jgi:hypothetical protein
MEAGRLADHPDAFVYSSWQKNRQAAALPPTSQGRLMKKITLLALTVGAIISATGAASSQVYLDIGPNAGPRYRDYDEPRYRDRERYRERERYGDRGDRGYYRPGRFRTFNGCQNGWTVQDGLCKPYRGY